MATIKKLSKLFSALGEQNLHRAGEIAAEIVQDEEKKGHRDAARLLRGYLQTNGANGSVGLNGGGNQPVFARLISEALSPQHSSIPLTGISLRRSARTELETVIKEWRSQAQLQAAGIARRSRLLFHGPPGCGKSLTAKALGKELSLPTYIVRFDGVIGAYLGQTAIHLRELFRFAERNPCVLMFDEVDALAKTRGSPMDVGELDRIVIAFMQELEHSHPAGLVIATSNLPGQLDPALWRRFDLILGFPAPSKAELSAFASSVLARYKLAAPADKPSRQKVTLRPSALSSKRREPESFRKLGKTMPPNARTVPPRNFFLNEQHELAPGEKRGGGPAPEYLGINWATKGTRINQSLLKVRDLVSHSRDPLGQSRYFVLARPTRGLEKKSGDKRKAQGGKLAVEIDYAENESRVFGTRSGPDPG